ncbi:MAG: ATP-binding protein [Bacteroidetes bacterium]|nr:ATP-binding protein [Bacteroidota bacterium]
MNTIRKLPIGIQDFEYLRTNNFLYVDKTQYIYQLVQYGKPYFLGRPRRFGKSLFLSTLKAYFEGKKELFEGLKIAELEKEWVEYPVFYLDFNRESYTDFESFNAVLDKNLRQLEEVWGKDELDTTPAIRFSGLIQRAHKKSRKQVVVLIDEYDKPLISSMEDPTLNENIRKHLKGFYGVLKAEDAHLKFVFLTGVTKFSKVSVFSDLNHLDDISLNSKYSSVCGITQTELEENFKPEIADLAKTTQKTYEETLLELQKLYNGYHFSENIIGVYNPFSLLNTFSAQKYRYYWFATGTPTFLVKHLANTGFEVPMLEKNVAIGANSLMDYQAESEDYVPLLYQSGYLTIKKYDNKFDEFILGFPNEEVKYGFLNELLPQFTPSFGTSSSKFTANGFIKLLDAGDIEGTMKMLQAYFATIKYDEIPKALLREKFYQFVFWQLFTLMGQSVETEVKNNKGRADAVVKTADSIYVFEFKMDDNATAEDALKQINSKDYAIPFITDHRKIVKIGVEFSQPERGIKRWLIE